MKDSASGQAQPGRPLPARELQELWFATRRRAWKSLVLVPATPHGTAVPIAQALAEVGGLIRMSPVQMINAEGLDLSRIATLVMDMSGEPQPQAAPTSWISVGPRVNTASWDATAVKAGQPLIIAVDPVVVNPLVLPLALAADAVLLCIEIGRSELQAVRHSIELIGRERLIGSVLLAPPKRG